MSKVSVTARPNMVKTGTLEILNFQQKHTIRWRVVKAHLDLFLIFYVVVIFLKFYFDLTIYC